MAKVNTKTLCVRCGKLPDLPLLPWLEGPPWLSRTGECRRCITSRTAKTTHVLQPELRKNVTEVGPQVWRKWNAALRGQRLSPKHRANISASLRSEENTRKLRARNLGRILSAETRAKIGAANRLRPLSPEHRAKISAALRARKLSEEVRRK